MRIVIVDYGMGNIRSIVNALNHIGQADVVVSSSSDCILAADRIVLPGVGHFATAMEQIGSRGIDAVLEEAVLGRKKAILGICLGMQLMGASSTEGGLNRGLGLINAEVTEFDRSAVRVPHVGVNQVMPCAGSRLFEGLGDLPDFYFTHSYKMLSGDDIGQSHCEYSMRFVAAFEKANCAGVQFHPELSQTNGLKLLCNFIERF
jgi:imidazole glycerol-phosphate synthase subunit HisH